jgi:hypothetical protein
MDDTSSDSDGGADESFMSLLLQMEALGAGQNGNESDRYFSNCNFFNNYAFYDWFD